MSNIIHGLDARTLSHMPGSRACGPYSVYREKITHTIGSDTTNRRVFLFGEHLLGNLVASTLGVYGSGTQVPGTTEYYVASPFFGSGTSGQYDVSLHALTVTIQCLGTAAGLVPSGMVMAGVIPQGVNRDSADTWSDLGLELMNRRGIHRYSAQQLVSGGVSYGSYPLDILSHTEMRMVAGVAGSTSDVMSEGLAPLIVILEPAATVANFALTVHAEWKFRARVNPMLISTHRVHAPVPETAWAKLMHVGQQTSGLLSGVATIANGLAKAGAIIGPSVTRAGVALGLA
jgi:hypothetical protein